MGLTEVSHMQNSKIEIWAQVLFCSKTQSFNYFDIYLLFYLLDGFYLSLTRVMVSFMCPLG